LITARSKKKVSYLNTVDAMFEQTDLVKIAVEKDSSKEVEDAINYYCKAVSYFIPAIHC
jgi:hypothetical protein